MKIVGATTEVVRITEYSQLAKIVKVRTVSGENCQWVEIARVITVIIENY